MKYILYTRNGFIKKFPLEKRFITLGRGKTCDWFIDEPFISKIHAGIKVDGDFIEIEDLGSKNGIYKKGSRLKTAKIEINESFRISHIEFFLKEGNPREFEISEDSIPLLERTAKLASIYDEETKAGLNLFDKALVVMMQMGFKATDFKDILPRAREALANTLREGSLYVVCRNDKTIATLSHLHLDRPVDIDPDALFLKHDVLSAGPKDINISKTRRLYSFHLALNHEPGALIYIKKSSRSITGETRVFLEDLAGEIAVIYKFLEHHNDTANNREGISKPLVTKNKAVIRLFERCKKIAGSELAILVEGETGVGKEVLARFIHRHSHRDKTKYIGINCSAIPENLLETDLFGHEKGAFTGAVTQRPGKLELSSGGTLVLDEIGDMPLNLQAKLLRVLQEKEFYRVGGIRPIKVDLRIIAMTNQDLRESIRQRKFREDLYYRIAHSRVKIPPLRNRKEDIVPLINHFVEEFSREHKVFIKGFSRKAISAMQNYDWPGNVRELENEVQCLITQADNGDMIDLHMLKEEITGYEEPPPGQDAATGQTERERIVALLEKYRWNKSRVAEELGISRMTLYNKLEKYGIVT